MGGVGTYATIMPKLLADAGHDVTVLAKYFDGAARRETMNGFEVHRLTTDFPWTGEADRSDDELFAAEMHSLRSYVGIFSREVHKKIVELHAPKPFDVVVSQDVEAPTWLSQDRRMVLGELPELPFVVFVHSPHKSIQLNNDDSFYERHEYHRFLYEKEVISIADGLIVASRGMQDEILREIGPDPSRMALVQMPCGEIPPEADFLKRVGSGENADELRIVFSGRLELRKGVDTLLAASSEIMRGDRRVTLHLIGRDTPHPTLSGTVGERLLARYGAPEIRDRMFLRGWMPREKLWAEYAAATVGVVPSPWEPFSFACQEMMACGTPVAASSTGGMADMIRTGKNGFLFEPDNVADLREKLEGVLGAAVGERREIGHRAASSIREYCDNGRVLGETVAFLERTIAKSRKNAAKYGRVAIPGNLPFGDAPAMRRYVPKSGAKVEKPAVVVPCYNLGQYLGECLGSLERQTFGPVKTFVIDDGSTDEKTIEILKAADRRANVEVKHFRNGGLPAARNRGARAVLEFGADAVMFLDCDDYVAPDYVEKAVGVLNRHPEACAVTAWTHTVGMMNTFWAPPHAQFPFLLAECMSTPPALIRSRALERVGGVHEDMRYAYEDWELWISLVKTCGPMLTIPEPLIYYRMREGSMARAYNFKTREHGRRAMTALHEELYQRYAREIVLLQDGFLYASDGRYFTEHEPMKKQFEQLLIDVAWNQKEWKYFKGLWEDEKAAHAATRAELEKRRGQG